MSVVAMAQPAAVPVEAVDSAAADKPRFVGFRIDGEEVVFTFDRTEYEFATRGDNGQRVAVAFVRISRPQSGHRSAYAAPSWAASWRMRAVEWADASI